MSKSSVLDKSFPSVQDQLNTIQILEKLLEEKVSKKERVLYLSRHEKIKSFLSQHSFLELFLKESDEDTQWIFFVLIFLEQAEHLLEQIFSEKDLSHLSRWAMILNQVESFYEEIGGLIGYQKVILQKLFSEVKEETLEVICPEGIDLRIETEFIRKMSLIGLEKQEEMGEIYVVGGAADRLKGDDCKRTPAAAFAFLGRSLLEGLIEDLEAREALAFKLFGKKITTPIAMMTSEETSNHVEILKLCEEKNWFGRPKESFFLFSQPLVPTVDEKGKWCLEDPHTLLLKPGGHGVLWKLAQKRGVFDWFKKQGKTKVFIRQINNPVAGVDYGLCSFLGIGHFQKKTFGFAGCPRYLHTHEGINVIIKDEEDRYALTNIEYCDLTRFSALDVPLSESSPFSKYPANTNLLFANIKGIEEVLENLFLPGVVLNFRPLQTYHQGDYLIQKVARLESTMQNIAEVIKTPHLEKLNTYITSYFREKTLVPLKQKYEKGHSLHETPEGCQHVMENNARQLLQQCGFVVSEKTRFLYHPTLGPFYSLIKQKLRKGEIIGPSLLRVEGSCLDIENLIVEGELSIFAKKGRCTLRKVVVKGKVDISVEEGGEFYAEDTILFSLTVNKFEQVTIKKGKIERKMILQPSWDWTYHIDSHEKIHLTRETYE